MTELRAVESGEPEVVLPPLPAPLTGQANAGDTATPEFLPAPLPVPLPPLPLTPGSGRKNSALGRVLSTAATAAKPNALVRNEAAQVIGAALTERTAAPPDARHEITSRIVEDLVAMKAANPRELGAVWLVLSSVTDQEDPAEVARRVALANLGDDYTQHSKVLQRTVVDHNIVEELLSTPAETTGVRGVMFDLEMDEFVNKVKARIHVETGMDLSERARKIVDAAASSVLWVRDSESQVGGRSWESPLRSMRGRVGGHRRPFIEAMVDHDVDRELAVPASRLLLGTEVLDEGTEGSSSALATALRPDLAVGLRAALAWGAQIDHIEFGRVPSNTEKKRRERQIRRWRDCRDSLQLELFGEA